MLTYAPGLPGRSSAPAMTLLKRDSERVASLEGLRGLAALAVVFFHVRYLTGFIGSNAHLFVDLFFVISGFVMARAYETTLVDRAGFATFVWRRFGRLYPLFLFSTLVFVLARVLQKGLMAHGVDLPLLDADVAQATGAIGGLPLPGMQSSLAEKITETTGYLLLLHGLGLFNHDILNFPSWSISTEFYTYLIFGLICLTVPVARRVPLYLALAIGGAVVAVGASIYSLDCLDPKAVTVCLDLGYDYGMSRCLAGFFAGCLLARLPRPATVHPALGAIQAGLLVAVIGTMALISRSPAWSLVVPLVMGALVYTVSADQGPVARFFSTRPLQFLGEISYSVYLLHVPLVMMFDIVIPRRPNPTAGVVFMLLLVVLARLSYLYVETPSREWFRRRFRVLPAPPPARLEAVGTTAPTSRPPLH